MSYNHDNDDEPLISLAITRRALPPSDPNHLPPVIFDKLMQAGIAQVERRCEAVIAALKDAGLSNAKV